MVDGDSCCCWCFQPSDMCHPSLSGHAGVNNRDIFWWTLIARTSKALLDKGTCSGLKFQEWKFVFIWKSTSKLNFLRHCWIEGLVSLAGRDKFCSAVSLRYVSLVSSPNVNRGTVFISVRSLQISHLGPIKTWCPKSAWISCSAEQLSCVFSYTVSLLLLKREMFSITQEPHSVCQAFILKKPL